MPQKFWLFLIGCFFLSSCLWADGTFPDLKVVPWNGHKAATSLTFDDGDPSHLDVVIPELNKRHLRATFFLIANQLDRKDEWRKILSEGHEIGNHTLDHRHAKDLSPADEESQVVGARNVLQKEFGTQVYTFAYPFVEISPGLKSWVEKNHLLSRGGYGTSYVLTPEMEPDWMNIPSRTTMTGLPFSAYQEWIDECYKKGGWLVWMIHGLEGTQSGWEPITRKTFGQILDGLQAKDIWVGTFLEVGAYFRAEKIFEKAKVEKSEQEETWTWDVPDHFPPDIFLKLQLETGRSKDLPLVEIWQNGKKISPDEKGFYPVDFRFKSLTLQLAPKN